MNNIRLNRRNLLKINDKFGRLTVLKLIFNPKKTSYLCKCDCGKEIIIQKKHQLTSGNTTSCGCYALEIRRKPPGEKSLNAMEYSYRYHSKKRGHIFELTKNQFRNLIQQNCYYCNASPILCNSYRKKNGKRMRGAEDISEEGLNRSDIYASGIDRLDSKIGYKISNCVPCCFDCNEMKNNRNLNEFLEHIKKIYLFQNVIYEI